MTRVERLTYANWIRIPSRQYERIHGTIESYGGRVKDCDFNWQEDEMVIFYEMAKSNRQEFEKELYSK